MAEECETMSNELEDTAAEFDAAEWDTYPFDAALIPSNEDFLKNAPLLRLAWATCSKDKTALLETAASLAVDGDLPINALLKDFDTVQRTFTGYASLAEQAKRRLLLAFGKHLASE